MIHLKNSNELKIMAESCKISAMALKVAEQYMKPNVSTYEIDNAIHKAIIKAGAKPSFLGYGGFPNSSCISVNDVVIHGIPSKKQLLKDGDLVSVDVGAFYNGFHGDNAYTFTVGEISPEDKLLLKVTEECLYKGIAQANVGSRIGDISYAIQTHAESHGFGVVRKYIGHGVGKNLHEDPEVPNYGTPGRGPRLAAGMTIAIEPMINLVGADVNTLSDGWTVKTVSGSNSAHFEHTILITNDGAKILTKV